MQSQDMVFSDSATGGICQLRKSNDTKMNLTPPPIGARLKDLESLLLSGNGGDESRESSGKSELGGEDHVGGRKKGWGTKRAWGERRPTGKKLLMRRSTSASLCSAFPGFCSRLWLLNRSALRRDLAVLTPRPCTIYAVARQPQRLRNFPMRGCFARTTANVILFPFVLSTTSVLDDRRPTHTMTSAYITLPPHPLLVFPLSSPPSTIRPSFHRTRRRYHS